MKTTTRPNYTIAVYAEDKKGLLVQILQHFNRAGYPVQALNVARTDLREDVLITIEAGIPAGAVANLLRKLERIIEVYKAEAYDTSSAGNPKAGLYQLDTAALGNRVWQILQQHNANICAMAPNTFWIRKIGTEQDLQHRYPHHRTRRHQTPEPHPLCMIRIHHPGWSAAPARPQLCRLCFYAKPDQGTDLRQTTIRFLLQIGHRQQRPPAIH